MKKGDIVKIKQYNQIDKNIKGGPGWAAGMGKYCGSEWRVDHIDSHRSNRWVWLEEVEDFVWDTGWLVIVNENNMNMFEFKEFEI